MADENVDVKKAEGLNPVQSLHKTLSTEFELGDFDSFQNNLLDKDKRQRLFKEASNRFDIGKDFDSFNSTIEPFLPSTGAEKFGQEVASAAKDFLFAIPTLLGDREAESKTAKFLGEHGIVGAAREGILAALPLNEKQEIATRQFLSEPLMPLRGWIPEEAPDEFLPDSIFGVNLKGARSAGWSITKGVSRILEGFSSPENIALLVGTGGTAAAARGGNALAQTAGRIIPAIFSADMISQEPELVEGIVHAVEQGDADEAIELATVATLNAGMAFMGGREALRRSMEGKPVLSEEAKPLFDRMKVAMEDSGKKERFMEKAEEYSTLMDEINKNAAEARVKEVAGEAPKNSRITEAEAVRRLEEIFGEQFKDIKPSEPLTVKKVAVVKSEGKPVKEFLKEIVEVSKEENLRVLSGVERTPKMNVIEFGKPNSKAVANFNTAMVFMEKRFPRLMSQLGDVFLLSDKEYQGIFPGEKSGANFIAGETNRRVFFRAENVESTPPIAGASPQLKGVPGAEKLTPSKTEATPSVETFVQNIAHEFRHNADLLRFGPEGFAALQEIGSIQGKVKIQERAARIEERGIRPQRYAVRLAERRARAQGRAAVRSFKEQLTERTDIIKAQSKGFSEEGYHPIRREMGKAWEMYEKSGRGYVEFSKDMVKELGRDVEPYLERFASEQKIMGEQPFPDRGGKAREWIEEDPITSPTAEANIKIGELSNRVELLKAHDKKWYQSLADVFSVQAQFVRINAVNTGLAVKNFFSKEALWQDMALKNAREIVTSVRRKGEFLPNQMVLQELAMLAESKGVRTGKYEAALRIWDTFRQDAMNKLTELSQPFSAKRNVVRELRGEIAKRDNRGENTRPFKITLGAAEQLKSSTVEASLWMESMIRKNPLTAGLIINKIARSSDKNLNFKNILKTGEVTADQINVIDVVGMMGRRVGLDVGILEIRRAAVVDGLARSLDTTPPESVFSAAPSQAKAFEGMAVHPTLKAWLTKMTKPKSKGVEILDKGISSIKMAAFWNPLFLPMYDVYQGLMAGVLRPHLIGAGVGGAVGGLPGAAIGFLAGEAATRTLSKGFIHAFKETELYQGAIDNGMASTPFANPFESFNRSISHVKRTLAPQKGQLLASALTNGLELTALPKAFRGLKTGDNALKVIGQLPLDAVSNIYNLSWGVAWQLDRGVRMSTYLHLLGKKGKDGKPAFTKKEAAQLSARWHGDYASVPVETRKMLNRFFFTPTFKIAMGKAQTEMVTSAIKGVKGGPQAWADVLQTTLTGKVGTRKLTARESQMASSLLYTASIIYGYHMFMESNGFTMDEFGVKYKRKVLTNEGEKELVVNHSTPANLYVKYFNRVKGAFDAGPHTAAKKLFNSFSWEITPMFRITKNWVNNRDDNGDPIILTTDSNMAKMGKSAKYLVLNSYQMLGLLGDDPDQVEARKKLADETDQAFAVMTQPFVFSYIKDTDLEIGQSKIQRMMRDFSGDIREGRIAPDDIPAHSNRLLEQINEIMEDSIERK